MRSDHIKKFQAIPNNNYKIINYLLDLRLNYVPGRPAKNPAKAMLKDETLPSGSASCSFRYW